MSNEYKKFFKAARQKQKQSPSPTAQSKTSLSEEELRAAFKLPPQKTSSKPKARGKRSKFPPISTLITLMAIFGVIGFGYSQPHIVEEWLNYFEIVPMTSASAADETPAKAAGANDSSAAKNAQTGEKSDASSCPDATAMTEEDLSHFNRLSERKRQLDLREQELNKLEEELHKQRTEVEARIQKLESVRGEISTVLKDRVEMDQQRVTTLVEFYSNMKPKQAADIFANLNEDLAVEILGKMKKKNAAEIMNLLPAEKARTLSEKFTGYKKR